MTTTNYLSSEQVSRIFTTYSAASIRELARKKKLPVVRWEPIFSRDAETIQALIKLTQGEDKSNGYQRR